MIEYKDALKIAKDYYYAKGQQELTKMYETDEMWIVYGGKKGQIKIGGAAITINKKNGQIENFILPSKENFAIIKAAKLVEIVEV